MKLTYTITISTNIHLHFYFQGTPIDTEAEQLSVAMQEMAMEVVEGQVEVTTADTSKGIGEEVKVGINIICFLYTHQLLNVMLTFSSSLNSQYRWRSRGKGW
jgi:hypothetical protein